MIVLRRDDANRYRDLREVDGRAVEYDTPGSISYFLKYIVRSDHHIITRVRALFGILPR